MAADAHWLDHLSWQRVAVAAGVALLIIVPAMRVRALSRSGAAAAFAVGTICFGFGGPGVGAALIAFFISGSLLSRLKTQAAARADRRTGKGHTRDAAQVFANGGVAAACSLLSAALPALAPIFVAGAVGALAAAAGDTWSTEIGALSPWRPRSIRTWRRVDAGASGGVTALGLAGAVLGGAAIGVVARLFQGGIETIAAGALLYGAVGLAGSVADSILGAHCQGIFVCRRCREVAERPVHACGQRTALVRGAAWLDNDGVNALATSAGAILAAAIALIRA